MYRESVSSVNKTHGMSQTRFYAIYCGIRNRCNNQKLKIFKSYGGRGIKNLWESYLEFKEDMYESYKLHVKEFGEEDTSIDRLNNNGNYCKENCRWATKKEQQNNTRKSPKYKMKFSN